jgi:hypothetical protein
MAASTHTDVRDLVARLTVLETQLRRTRRAAGVALSFVAVAAIAAWTRTPAPEVITVRGLVVVDSAGRERITIGAMPGRRRSPAIGMAIRDSLGDERFGVGLAADGLMGMGFDAPRGAGNDANRERINITAGPTGLASIRFLDKQTIPRAYLMLLDDNRVYLQMNADTSGKRMYRMFSALHDTSAAGVIP